MDVGAKMELQRIIRFISIMLFESILLLAAGIFGFQNKRSRIKQEDQAEQFALDFPPMVTEIEGIAGQMSNVVSEIGNQILKIENYIEELNSKITTLTCQLNAL